MEKRLAQKCNTYLKKFKINIKQYIDENITMDESQYTELMQFIFDYDAISITKEDFTKRKRVKNIVPFHERCCALRANGQQCTRRKKDSDKFCGTHIKGIPHGEISANDNNTASKSNIKKEVWAQDIAGIIYYIDSENNVYNHNDIVNNIVNPKIIAKYEKITKTTIRNNDIHEEHSYSIPTLFNKK